MRMKQLETQSGRVLVKPDSLGRRAQKWENIREGMLGIWERDAERVFLLEVKARESLSANELEAGWIFLKYVAALL